MSRFVFTATILLSALALFQPAAAAQEPGWSLRVVTFGAERARIQATPIVSRPYRPLHFYGNTVRRRHYRGQTAPRPRSTRNGFRGR